MKYLLIDSYNLFCRAMFTINDRDLDICKSMFLHTIFNMINKACNQFQPDHLIMFTDGHGSWRKELHPLYKENRVEQYDRMTPYEILRNDTLKTLFVEEFLPFIESKTNITYLGFKNAEADDLIARFVKLHPNDICIILSTDNDYVQLVSENVMIYNSMEDRLITNKCVINVANKKPIKFKLKSGKISVSKTDNVLMENESPIPFGDWVEYSLFMKCIRGDSSDNIFSSYPGVREKSSKNNVGIMEAFKDRNNRGYAWTTFMNSKWKDPFGVEHLVYDEYLKNKKLIDLNEIPDDLKQSIDDYIKESEKPKEIVGVGVYLMKFLNKWRLVELEKNVSGFSTYYNR